MVAHIHTPNIRRIYDRPRQRGTAADPGKVPTCVQVAVRPETTVRALETMFRALPQLSTTRAGLAGVGRVGVLDGDARSLGLVFDEGLQLSPCPAVQAATHALASLDPLPDMRQVFHRDLGDAGINRRLNNGLARFVVNVLHAPHLLAGDLPELLFRALAAVGLKTAAQGKVTVALVAQSLAAEDPAQAVGGEEGARPLRVVLENPDDGEGALRLDQPIAPFAERRFGARFVRSEVWTCPLS